MSQSILPITPASSEDEMSITIIVPIRITENRRDLVDRVENYIIDTDLPKKLDVIIVDDGSKDDDYIQLKKKEKENFRVMRTGARYYENFSLARARNFAAQRASGDFIIFLDADLVPYPGFFRDLLREAKLLRMKENVHCFLMVPVIYLTDEGLQLMKSSDPDEWRAIFINSMLINDRAMIEKCSSGTSVILLDRLYYLARGGQDIGFEGWGFEDYEFTNRLIRRDRRYPLPKEWLSMAGNLFTINKYEGWKSVYRLYGDWLAAKAIYLFHIPHPIEQAYHARKDQNMRYLIERMKDDASNSPEEPQPLPDFNAGSTLLLRNNPFCYDREFAPSYGHIDRAHEDDFADTTAFAERVKELKYSRVVFGNPYANEKLKGFYSWCRENSQPYTICERGALPDSVYHDKNGFLNDSASYDPYIWNNPLTDDERARTVAYVEEIRFGAEALEAQSQREDAAVLRKRLGLKLGKKVLFVPFQQPNDTVIREFAGSIGSFSRFRDEIERLARDLGDGWAVVYKKHPAEDELLPIPGAISADDAHVYDLLEICDAVALINSGVGVYGMMFGKPVYVFGSSWYAHQGLCRPISENEDAATVITNGFSLDYECVLRFIHYLRYRFYSFGEMTTKKARYADGTPITATMSIKYYEIRIDGEVRRIQRKFTPISTESPLFDRYKAAASNQKPTVISVSGGESVLARAREALSAAKHEEAADLFIEAAKNSRNPVSHYRTAAEVLDKSGNTQRALRILGEALEMARNKRPIQRRLREMSRPKWLRRMLPEWPYPYQEAL